MKQRIYLDTSVISALGDLRAPDRQALTRAFFERIDDFDAVSSQLAKAEIESTHDDSRRTEMIDCLNQFDLLPITPEAEELARQYLAAAVLPASAPRTRCTLQSRCSAGRMFSSHGTFAIW